MPQTQRLIIVSFALIAGIGLGLFISRATYLEAPVVDVIPVVIPQATSTIASTTQSTDTPTASNESPNTICPADAKQCPDGSYVAREGEACEFAACPTSGGGSSASINCTPEQRQAEACIELYAPVCAAVQVQCITTPCEPIPKTYANSCFACADDMVTSYTEGACAI